MGWLGIVGLVGGHAAKARLLRIYGAVGAFVVWRACSPYCKIMKALAASKEHWNLSRYVLALNPKP